MKIYTRIFIVVAALAAMAACQEEQPIELAVDSTEIAIGPDGGVKTVKVAASQKWVATTAAPWITISPANGIGSVECKVMIDSALVGAREAVVRISSVDGEFRKDFTVKQDGYKYELTLDKPEVVIPSYEDLEKRFFSVKVKSNFDFDVEVPEAITWLEMEKTDYSFDERVARPRFVTLKFSYDINFKEEGRDAEIKFHPVDSKLQIAKNQSLAVSQNAAETIEEGVKGDSLAIIAIGRTLGMLSSWDTSEKLENWSGIKVWKTKDARNGRVRSAQFTMFKTTEPIPFQVRYLTEAEELYFYGNSNTFLIGDLDCGPHICELTKLRKLTIGAYGLSDLHPDIVNLKNLEYLNLESNNFQIVPELIAPDNFPKLTALILNACTRYSITDLYNDTRTNVGGFIDELGIPMKLLMWDNLDTLRLSANYLQGKLPTDEEMAEILAQQKGKVEYWRTSDVNIADSIAVGNRFFDENDIPKVLPETDFMAINLNRFYGELPNWLLYHPKLDMWYPDILVWYQEGRAKDGNKAGFSNAPTNLNYYYDLFVNKKYNPKNFTEE